MTYIPVNNRLGTPSSFSNIDSTTPVQLKNDGTNFANNLLAVGTILDGYDPTLGGAEFIYLPGVASNAVGMLVTYNSSPNYTVSLASGANQDNPVAVSMSANVTTTNFSWYQISGLATILKTAVTVNPQVSLFMSATSGRVKVIASAGRQILGCRSANTATVTSTTSTVVALIQRPFLQGQIT